MQKNVLIYIIYSKLQYNIVCKMKYIVCNECILLCSANRTINYNTIKYTTQFSVQFIQCCYDCTLMFV